MVREYCEYVASIRKVHLSCSPITSETNDASLTKESQNMTEEGFLIVK